MEVVVDGSATNTARIGFLLGGDEFGYIERN